MNFLYKLWRVFIYTLKDIKGMLSEWFYENRHDLVGFLMGAIVFVCVIFDIGISMTAFIDSDTKYPGILAIGMLVGLVVLQLIVGAIIIHMIDNWKEVE